MVRIFLKGAARYFELWCAIMGMRLVRDGISRLVFLSARATKSCVDKNHMLQCMWFLVFFLSIGTGCPELKGKIA